MFSEILRAAVAAYFCFSGLNKIFFFDRFSEYLTSFFNLLDGLGAALAGGVIVLEIIFATVVIFWTGKLLPRVLALIIAVPFTAYNLWIFFVLGLTSCHCAYSATGESLASPLFSIAVLAATLASVFFFTRKNERHIRLAPRIGVFALIALATGGISAYIWREYQSSDLVALHTMIADQIAETDRPANPRFEAFIQLSKGRPSRAALFISRLLGGNGDERSEPAVYVLRAETAEYVDDMMLSLQSKEDDTILDPPDDGRLDHLGVEVYRDGVLVHRADRLPEMTAAKFDALAQDVFGEDKGTEASDRTAAAVELADIVRSHVEGDASGTPRIAVSLLMERACAECDADLLAMLDSYFFDLERFEVTIAYFMGAAPEDGRGIVIPPAELASLKHWSLYPNKLLLIDFGGGDVAPLATPDNLQQLDTAIQAEFEKRGISLF